MVQVVKTPTGKRFHRSRICTRVVGNPNLEEISIHDIEDLIPCRVCFKDAPIPGSVHAYCPSCNTFSACPHNGGILVPLVRRRRSRSPYMDPGEVYTRMQYIWPEALTAHVS